jgi:hypothetical protein
MTWRRGIPLNERVAVGRPSDPEPAAAEPEQPLAARPARRRHCWVRLPDRHDEAEGLVLHWAHDGGWVALVLYVVERPTGPVAVQEWLSAGRLRPA